MRKRLWVGFAFTFLLLGSVPSRPAQAQPARNGLAVPSTPPPQFRLQLDGATVDRALIEVARAGKVNIIADATDGGTTAQTAQTLTTSHTDSAIGWISGLANEFDLTFDRAGAASGLDLMLPSAKSFVLWREPDVDPLLQQARQLAATAMVPAVATPPGVVDFAREEGELTAQWKHRWIQQQQALVKRDLVAFLQAQAGAGQSIHQPRDFALSQVPAPLQASLRHLARQRMANGELSGGLGYLEDEAWKNARLKLQYIPGEGQAYLWAQTVINGEPSKIDLAAFRPR